MLAPTTRCRTQRRNQFAHETTAAATAAHTRYLSSPAEATLHRKTQSFVLQLPPQNKAHATVMQPLQCIWQHHVANPHVSTHMATEHDNNHAAIPMPSATRDSRGHIELRTKEQPLVAEHRGGTYSRMKRPQPQPPHTRGTFHRRLQPLYTEKNKVSCSTSFLPKTKPMQHSCSHYNTFRSITVAISLRHMATPDDNNHAATPMRSANTPLPFVTTSLRHHFPLSSDVKSHTTLHCMYCLVM